MTKNTIVIDFKSNPELTEIIGGKRVGENCELVVSFRVIENNGEEIKGTIQKITKEYGEEEHEPAEPSADGPVAISVKQGDGETRY